MDNYLVVGLAFKGKIFMCVIFDLEVPSYTYAPEFAM